MRKMLLALPMTLVAGAALLSAPADARPKTLKDCRTDYVSCVNHCPATNSEFARNCRSRCSSAFTQCYNDVVYTSPKGGTGAKNPDGGVAVDPKQPGPGRPTKVPGGGGVVVPKQPGGGVAVPKWSPKSSPIGTYHPRPPFSTTGPVGTWHSAGSPKGGPILLRSTGRR
jgi:hypothetical protein